MRSSAVVKCLDQLFSLCGMTSYIHSVLGRSPNSREVKGYLIKRGAASTHSTRYHPIGYSQVERHNGILWKAIRLALKSHNSPVDSWEAVLPDALHAIRSLLCVCVCAFVRVQMLPGTNCFLVLVGGLWMGNRCLHRCLGLAQCFWETTYDALNMGSFYVNSMQKTKFFWSWLRFREVMDHTKWLLLWLMKRND